MRARSLPLGLRNRMSDGADVATRDGQLRFAGPDPRGLWAKGRAGTPGLRMPASRVEVQNKGPVFKKTAAHIKFGGYDPATVRGVTAGVTSETSPLLCSCTGPPTLCMVNPRGVNGGGVKEYPEDSILKDAFERYALENSGAGLSYVDQCARLKYEFGLDIKKIGRRVKLAQLRKKVGATSVRNSKGSRTDVETRQGVMDLKPGDVAGGWGVTQTKGRLANVGVLIHTKLLVLGLNSLRDALCQILHDEFGDEFDSRFVGKKKLLKHRTPLKALGPFHQEHCDGHEKLSEQGLDIGAGIHLPIYASKDQFSSFILMPNVRLGNYIAHYYMDLVERRGFKISLQLTTDMGSEVIEMHKIHVVLRDDVAPQFTPPQWPHGVKQSSTNNTPIESFWRWLQDGEGHSTKMTLQSGAATGIFLPHDEIHRQTFYWLFVPLIQEGLDNFRQYWNNHRLGKSKGKLNGSGSSPLNMLISPTSAIPTARDCSINVNPDTLYRLREAYGGEEARDAAFRFVSREFQADADGVYADLGCPEITLPTAWDIFSQVVEELQRRAGSSD
ncbi:hypothetical protein FB451DRAFT_1521089 [Mycena latifolia]|nr:hypothetical protein FB451DRAFT_1521089 [Mycena latifolia]